MMNRLQINLDDKNRDASVDIAKGILIVLVVYGHTWPWCRDFIYLFHMAAFFIASGYCYKQKVVSVSKWIDYIKKKIIALYLPFIICNGTFLLLNNLFVSCGVLTSNERFLSVTTMYPVQQTLSHIQGWPELFNRLIKTLAFVGVTELGTATWFLSIIFVVQLVHVTIDLITRNWSEKKKTALYIVLLFVSLIVADVITNNDIKGLFIIVRFPCSYAAYLMGIMLKRVSWQKIYTIPSGILSLIVLIMMSLYFHVELSAENIENMLVYFTASVCGWVLIMALSKSIKVYVIGKLLALLGRKTLPILCLHVISFKIVSMIIILCHHLPDYMLASFHIIFDVNEWWKILYTVVGIVMPICLYSVYRSIKVLVSSKGHLNLE